MDNPGCILFGGSFNPVHNGHLRIIDHLQKQFRQSKIIVMPAAIAPHKAIAEVMPFRHRFAMLRLALKDSDQSGNIKISALEGRRKEISYTFLTMRNLTELCPQPRLSIAIGYDMFASLPQWKYSEELKQKYQFIVFARKSENNLFKDDSEGFTFKPIFIENPEWVESSSEIRNLLIRYHVSENEIRDAAFFKLAQFLPESLLKYILKNKFYKDRK